MTDPTPLPPAEVGADPRPTVLFLPYPSTSGTWGSSLYLCAIADACARRGYRPVFHACPPTADAISAAGHATVHCRGAAPRPGHGAVRDFYDVCRVLGFEDEPFWDEMVRDEVQLVAELAPVAIVSDFRLSAPLTARATGTPLVSLAAWATDPRFQARGDDPLDAMARSLAARWGHAGVETLPEMVSWHADRRLATSVPRFEPELDGLDRMRWTGYLDRASERRGWPAREDWPERLVVAYTSTAPWGSRRVVETMARAANDVGAAFWCVTTAAGAPEQVSDRFSVVAYLPFDEVLPHTDALVFHGGQGTALASLHYGVPSLVAAGDHYERGYNARRLEELGAGRAFELYDLVPSKLRHALAALVEDPAHRAAARRLQGEVRSHAGADAAVDAVDELVGSRVP
jgi:UDP:flavonoid glycosyltransferase YjiC (YdhE family)